MHIVNFRRRQNREKGDSRSGITWIKYIEKRLIINKINWTANGSRSPIRKGLKPHKMLHLHTLHVNKQYRLYYNHVRLHNNTNNSIKQ